MNEKAKTALSQHFHGNFEINRNTNHINEAGVMTLVENKPDLICKGIHNVDTDGRIQITEISYYGTPLSIVNIYSPNSRTISGADPAPKGQPYPDRR